MIQSMLRGSRYLVPAAVFGAVAATRRRVYRLNTSEVPLSRLAAELGFSESSSFQRAINGWTGCSPGVYRRIGRG